MKINPHHFKKLVLMITFFGTVCYSSVAQESTFHENIINYLRVNGTEKQYLAAYDQMFEMIKTQVAPGSVTEDGWVILKRGKSEAISEILGLLASAYQKHFSKDEITGMLAFYNTEVGAQMVTSPETLTPGQLAEVAAFFESGLGQTIKEKLQVLSQDTAQISEYWSRDLYMETMVTINN